MLNRRQTLAGLAGATLAGALPGVALARTGTIVDVAAANPDFSTLVTAVQTAGLADTLQGPGPFTVFAPTDDAFAALPAGTIEGLLEDPEALARILAYHVVPGLMTAEFLSGQRGRIEMVSGEFIRLDATGDAVRINRAATVTAADVEASNGVIHVIDRVLLPS